jgi:hypothetical protein
LATITGTHRRRLVASSIAIILAAAMMTPATTDARGGGGGSSAGHGGMHGGHGHFGAPHSLQGTGRRSMSGLAIARAFPFSSHPHMSFSHRFALHHSHAIGSHVATLGYDGIWLDNYAYAPTVVVAQPILQSPAHVRAPSVKTPSAARQGIVVVRGDTKTYVTFPSAKPG